MAQTEIVDTKWFAVAIRAERMKTGLSKERMAHELGVTLRAYAYWEAGRTFPRFAEFERICRYFGWPHPAVDTVAMGLYLDAVLSISA